MVRYDYKDSGIEWLGIIPKHWKLDRIRDNCVINDKALGNQTQNETLINYLDIGNVNSKGIVDFNEIKELTFEEAPSRARRITQKHDTVISSVRTNLQAVAYIDFEKDNLICSTGFFVCRPIHQTKLDNKFLYYFLLTEYSKEYFFSRSVGVSYPAIDDYKFGSINLPLPPLPEQRAIAAYLDKACRRIDDMIDIKQKQLEKLNGIRKAKIYKAVTQGIHKVKEWKELNFNQIDKIPNNWKLLRFKTISKLKYGLGQPPNEMIGGLPIIRATNVYRGKIDIKDLLFVDPNDVPYERDPILRKDDIIVVRSGAYTADSAIIPEEFDGAVTGYDLVVRCNKNIFPKFVAYALLSKYLLEDQLLLLSSRAAQPHLNREELGNSKILLPDYNEQKIIAEHLDIITEKIDNTIENTNDQINILQSYRKSLIHECVTGKKQVWEGKN